MQITAALLISIISLILSTVTLIVTSNKLDETNKTLNNYTNHSHQVIMGTTIPDKEEG